MANIMKKHDYLLPFARIFTRGMDDAYESVHFESTETFGDESFPSLASPSSWSSEAVAVMAEAAHPAVPADLRANEENTVPSWLWKHQHVGSRREAEADLRDIFNRCVGSATAKAWRLGFFTSEKHARAFYDEACFALMNRHIAIVPEVLAPWGLSWAYGIDETPRRASDAYAVKTVSQLSNALIDSLLEKNKDATSAPLWKKIFAARAKDVSTVSLQLSDIASDWQSASPNPARAAIDLMALRRDDGTVDIDALRHTTRVLAVLLDLQDRADVTTTIVNLAPVLLALGLPYDSDAARAMAASLAALVTAEFLGASAEMAALRGMSSTFADKRDAVMRSLRNHRRAAYGDNNDYEKLSVLPAPLPLKNCPDLSLAAEAQHRWDETLAWAQTYGLRATQATDMTLSRTLTLLTSCASSGLEPMPRLTELKREDSGVSRKLLHPAVAEAFARMGYTSTVIAAATHNIVGTCALRKAPGINVSSLKAKGFDDVALEKIESYLPCVNSLRLALTPWVIGVEACAKLLKVSVRDLESPRFNLFKRLGFTDKDIDEADRYIYGYGSVRNAKPLPLRHRPLFACGEEVSSDARLRMAASVQSFISGDTGLNLRLPTVQSAPRGAEATLAAWSAGLRSLTLVFDPDVEARPMSCVSARRIKAKSQAHAKPIAALQRKSSGGRTPVLASRKGAGIRRIAR